MPMFSLPKRIKSRHLTLTTALFIALTLLLIFLPSHSPTIAQDDTQTVSITLLFPSNTSGARDYFTIRVDDPIDTIDLTSLNFRWNTGQSEQRLNLDFPQIRALASNLEAGQCIQLFPSISNQSIPLCNNVFPFPITPGNVFWTSNIGIFTIFQGDTQLASCSTVGSTSCTFEWPINAPTPTNTPEPDFSTDEPPETTTPSPSNLLTPNLILYTTDNSLTLYINSDTPVSLVGFQMQSVINDNERYTLPATTWDSLQLNNQNAESHACYILERQNATETPPSVCNTIHRLTRANSDIFWYDSTRNSPRSVSILAGDTRIQVCPAQSDAGCEITYYSAASNDTWQPIFRPLNGVEMALVPSGCFMMGFEGYEEDETPVHQQCLEQPFWIDRTEVTRAQYTECVNAGICPPPHPSEYSTAADQPINFVSWIEARDYCVWRDARLPTEREWEYTARGPDSWAYPWGPNLDDTNMVWGNNSEDSTQPVGSRPQGASWVGAVDMSGNVWEWVSSLVTPYPYDAEDGRENAENLTDERGLRGGSYYDYSPDFRAANRDGDEPTAAGDVMGLRCARDFTIEDMLQN